MAHEWIDLKSTENLLTDMMNYGRRRCAKCGVEQVKHAEHLWMRVTGYRWVPLAGRCPMDKKGVDND